MFILRNIPELEHTPPPDQASTDNARRRYVDADAQAAEAQAEDAVAGGELLLAPPQVKLRALRRDIRATVAAVHEYTLPWAHDAGIDPNAVPAHSEYLADVCRRFEAFVSASLEKVAQRRRERYEQNAVAAGVPPSLLMELSHQQRSVASRYHARIPRGDMVAMLAKHAAEATAAPAAADDTRGSTCDTAALTDSSDNANDAPAGAPATHRLPFVLHGTSGSGKTFIMSAAACEIQKSLTGRTGNSSSCPILIYRLLGTSPDSGSFRLLVQSIVSQLTAILLASNSSDNSKQQQRQQQHWDNERQRDKLLATDDLLGLTAPQLVDRMHSLLRLCATEQRSVVLLLDSLDQLAPMTDTLPASIASLFPVPLPPGVAAIVSVADDSPVLRELQRTLPASASIASVPPATGSFVREIVSARLLRQDRCLSEQQLQELEDACKHCPTPLYAHVAARRAVEWRTFVDHSPTRTATETQAPPAANIPQNKHLPLPPTCEGLIHQLLRDVEDTFGLELVRAALALLSSARRGLSASELQDVLSCDDSVLNALFSHWTPPVRRLPPLLWARVQRELNDVLVTRSSGGVHVLQWYHRAFAAACHSRYLKTRPQQVHFHSLLAEFFKGTWAHAPKPYVDTRGTAGEAKRFVAQQPIYFSPGSDNNNEDDDHDHDEVPNLRKLDELPFHLSNACAFDDLGQ